MTFKDISFKMFMADIKKYRLFILCNLMSIAILYTFLSIFYNKQFRNSQIVDPMISSNIIAPTFLVVLFTCIFIPYTQRVFIKDRQKDYGILLTLGMTEKEVRNSVLVENIILCMVFLVSGLILGTFMSLFFWAFIRDVIGIDKIDITISVLSYKITIIYVIGIFVISLIVNLFAMIKSTIYEKIKYTEKAEGGKHHSMKLLLSGLIITIASFVVMILFYRINSNVWLLSLFICMFGSVLIFFNGEALIEFFQKKYYKKYLKNIFLISDIKYYYGKNKNVFLVTTWIFFTILFFIMFSLVTYPNFINNSNTYHPFHLVYPEIKDSFKPLEDDEINLIVKENGNSIILSDRVNFVRNGAFTIFSADDVNRLLKQNYQVKPNSFIFVYPYDLNDGYPHDTNLNVSNIDIDSNKAQKRFSKQDTAFNPLFGEVNCISDYIILVNKDDYEWIALYNNEHYIQGTLHLYNFDNWKSSGPIANEVWSQLIKKNKISDNKDNKFFKVSSRIEAYNTALKSSNFIIFNMIFISLLLYFSAIIMIHFKLKMEYKAEKKKYFSLYRIGVKEIEIKKMLSDRILVIFLTPLLYAIIINIAYSYYINSSYGYGLIGILCALLTSLVFLMIHLVVYKLYIKSCYRKVVTELCLN